MPRPHPPHRRTAALAAAGSLAALALAGASPSVAAPWEQVSRADSPNGGSLPHRAQYQPKAVGDLGRYVGYARAAEWTTFQGPPVEINDVRNNTAWIRDVQTDVNLDFGGGLRRVFGISRDERVALIGRYRNGRSQIVLQPLPSGQPSVIEEFNGSVFVPTRSWPTAQLSGDGLTAVISTESLNPPLLHATGTYVLKNGIERRVSPDPFRLASKRAVSDDGRVFLGASAVTPGGPNLWGPDFTRTVSGGRPVLSGNGRWAAWWSYEPYVGPWAHVLDVQTGQQRKFAIPPTGPDAEYSLVVNWISPDGSKLTVVPSARTTQAAKALQLTIATGQWSPFAPRFGRSLTASSDEQYTQSRESVNGRFAAVPSATNQVSLVDLTEQHIVGANQGLSAASYVSVAARLFDCPVTADVTVRLAKPDFWAPSPQSATIKVTQGATVLAEKTLTDPAAPLLYATEGWLTPTPVPANGLNVPFDPAGAAVKVAATVTDDQGRVVSETWTAQPDDTGGCA